MSPYYESQGVAIYCGDALTVLRTLGDASVQCVVTSPPYWGLRDYGTATWEGGDPNCAHRGRVKPRNDTSGSGVEKGRFAETRGTQPAKTAYAVPVREICKCGAPDGWDTTRGNGSHGTIHRGGRSAGRSGNKARKLGEERGRPGSHLGGSVPWEGTRRNRRTVWTVATFPFTDAHFATFPPKLIEPCILAGTKPGDTVLDPFMGAGTTALVARNHGRRSIGIELNPAYIDLAAKRLAQGVLDLGGVA